MTTHLVGLAVLFVRFQGIGQISGHVVLRLRGTNVLGALRRMSAQIAELARPEAQDSWIGACLNFHHFDFQSWLP